MLTCWLLLPARRESAGGKVLGELLDLQDVPGPLAGSSGFEVLGLFFMRTQTHKVLSADLAVQGSRDLIGGDLAPQLGFGEIIVRRFLLEVVEACVRKELC